MRNERIRAKPNILFLMHRQRENLYRTLEFLSSVEKQSLYKKAMPFIHVPRELLAQWNDDFVTDESSFQDLFTTKEWRALSRFDFQLKTLTMKLPFHLPDVPEIFTSKPWLEIEAKAKETLKVLIG